ncbi:MAG TPA: PAS domain S-box protein [Methanocella sp.]|nr:PAS domain S-box protein [Methanocella sp.]
MKERILVVEDEAIVLLDLKNRLNTLGYVIVGSTSYGDEAIRKAEETRPDVVLMDIGLKGKVDGIEAADRIRKLLNIPIIYLTANSDFTTLQRAKVTEPFGYILKPFDERELRTTIEMALYKHALDIKLNETRRWMETTLTSIGDAVITTDVGARITFMNPAAEALTGWKAADAVNRELSEVLHLVEEDTRAPVTGQVESALQRNSPFSFNGRTALAGSSGREVPVDSSVSPIKDNDGKAIGVAFVFRDVSEKRKVDNALRASEASLAKAQEIAHIGDWALDLRTHTMRWSSQVWRILGISSDRLASSSRLFLDSIVPEDRPQVEQQFRDIPPDWKYASFDFRIARPDGTIRYVHDEAEFTRDEAGKVVSMFGTIQDVTDRKLAEEALKVSEERFFNVTNSTLDAIVSINDAGTIIFWNKAAERIFGYSKYEAIGKPVWIILPPEHHAAFCKAMECYNVSGKSMPRDSLMQYDGLKKGGQTFPVEMSLSGWKEKGRSFFTAIIRDITERRHAEEAVRRSEGWLASTFNGFPLPAAISTIDEGRIVEVNDRFCALTGFAREELVGRTSTGLGIVTAAWRAGEVERYKASGSFVDRETMELRKKSGESFPALFAASLVTIEGKEHLLSLVTDLTGIRQAERERAEAEELYRGFASDARDALTVIEGDRVEFASPKALEIYGVEKHELAPDTHVRLAAPEEQDRVRASDGDGNGNGDPIDYWIVRKDGSRRRIRSRRIVTKKDGRTVRRVVITRDITDESAKPEKAQR